MAHMIETLNGKVSMAWAGQTPWHGLGKQVPADLTPTQMLEAAGLDWKVKLVPTFARFRDTDGKDVSKKTGQMALVRDADSKILDVVGNKWNPVQNHEAFEFFNDFIAAGEMEMHTAGSLRGGQIVWALAKVKESFELFDGKDRVDSYLLFTNPFKFGQSIDIRFTPIRVVCNNTLTLSLQALNANKSRVRVSHRNVFDATAVKETMGVASSKLAKYKEMSEFLTTKRFNEETLTEYFQRVFPVLTQKTEARKESSKSALTAKALMDIQPGAELGEGSWWQAFNASTFLIDHVTGKSQDSRLTSAWYGANQKVKTQALQVAVEMANAS